MLRQPLETGKVTISRVQRTVTYPAEFLLVGAMNPCPCGYLGSKHHYCTCTPKQINNYQNRISGPIKDRMDILLQLQAVDLQKGEVGESSDVIRKRVIEARDRQLKRYGKQLLNSRATFEEITATSPLTATQKRMLGQWLHTNHWSNRVQLKIIRIARTISDLAGVDMITDEALWEAMSLRRSFMKGKSQVR